MTYDDEGLKIARQQIIKTEGRNAILRIHYLISERGADDVQYVTDVHELWLGGPSELRDIMHSVGFSIVEFQEDKLSDGALIGVK